MHPSKNALTHAARITLASSLLVLLSACGNQQNTESSSSAESSTSVSSSVSSSSSSSAPVISSISSSSSSSISSASSISSIVVVESSSSSSTAPTNTNLIINDDFESGAAGEVPPGWQTVLGYGLIDHSRTPDAGSSAEIDNSKAHSGSNSVKVSTSTAQAPHFIFQELPSGMSSIYVRTWMYSSVQLGGGSAGSDGDHAHFLGTLQTPGFDDGESLRFGPVKKAYLGGFIPKPTDTGSINQTAHSIPANKWTCVEWAAVKNSSFDKMYAWVDGTEVLSAEGNNDWSNGAKANFVNANATKYISFGWRQFGGGANVSSIWFDDIAVGTERIGCN